MSETAELRSQNSEHEEEYTEYEEEEEEGETRYEYTAAGTLAEENTVEEEGTVAEERLPTPGQEIQYVDSNLPSDQFFYKDLPSNVTPAMFKRILGVELERLKNMKPWEFVEKMQELTHLHRQMYEAADKFIKQVVTQIPYITPIFKHLSEYDQKASDKVLAASIEEWEQAGISSEDREVLMANLKERMLESARVNFDFTHRISYVASPLTVWRLAACTAVWAGNNELETAHTTTRFDLDEGEGGASARRPGEADAEAAAAAEAEEAKRREAEEAAARLAEEERAAAEREAELARLEAERYVEGQLNPEELMALPRPQMKEWVKYVYTASDGRVICYVRAPPDCLVSQDRIICTFGNALAQWPNLPGNAEVIGHFICIQPQHPKLVCILPEEPWLVGIPHQYGKNPTREVVVFMMEAEENGPGNPNIRRIVASDDQEQPKSPWVDLQTSDISFEDSRYLEFKLTRLSLPLAFAPAARIRRDTGELGRAGGKLTSLVDKRVVLVVPSGALKIQCQYSIQVQPISQHHAHLLRDQNLSFMAQFTACSPLVIFTGPKKILFKTAAWTLPLTDANPSNQVVIMSNASMPDAFLGHKKNKTHKDEADEDEQSEESGEEDEEGGGKGGGGAEGEGGDDANSDDGYSPRELDPFQRSLLLPKLLAGANSSHSEIAIVFCGLEDSDWRVWEGAELLETKSNEVCSFNCSRLVPRKFMAIQTRTVVDNDSLIQMAQVLERSLSQRIVYACLRQKKDDPSTVSFALCLTHDLEMTLGQMAARGFTEGGKPIGPLFVYERQQFDVTLKGNVRPKRDPEGRSSVQFDAEKGRMRITFNTSLKNEYTIEVEEFDSTAQVACEKYRGFIEISYKQLVKVPAKKGKDRSNPVGPKKFTMELHTVLLCQLLITLPKKGIEVDVNQQMLSYHFEPQDVVTNETIIELARRLPGETWRRLGAALDLSRTHLQAIGGLAESSGKNKALTMLRSWIKNLELKVDRVERLRQALSAIGRSDLAAELLIVRDKPEFTNTPSSNNTPNLVDPPTFSN